jgi:hypothetical protein
MSTTTKAGRRNDIVALLGVYGVPCKLSPGQLDQCAEMARDEVFMNIFSAYKHLFRVSATYAHGDAWPAGYLGLAGRQYVVDGGTNRPARFIHVGNLPMFKKNSRIAGTTTQPILYLADRTFRFFPTSVSMVIETYKLPIPLADSAVADSATDTMPKQSEPYIARGGCERALKMMVDEKIALELTEAEIAQIVNAQTRVYADMAASNIEDILKD